MIDGLRRPLTIFPKNSVGRRQFLSLPLSCAVHVHAKRGCQV